MTRMAVIGNIMTVNTAFFVWNRAKMITGPNASCANIGRMLIILVGIQGWDSGWDSSQTKALA